LLPPEDAFAWLHGGDGLVGWGRVAEIEPVGEGRFAEASAWWKDLSARAVVRDPVQVPGSGLVAFASLSFGSHAQDSDDPNAGLGHSRLVVPRSEEHTSELQSRFDLVCRLLLEKKNSCIHAPLYYTAVVLAY